MQSTNSTIEDRDEILQLLYRYAHCFDNGDAEGWADLFTDDAYYDAGVEVVTGGRDALVSFAKRDPGHPGRPRHVRRHVLANPVIDVLGDSAEVHSYFIVLEETTTFLVGTYDDEVVRTPAGWRFAKRVCRVTAPSDFTPDS